MVCSEATTAWALTGWPTGRARRYVWWRWLLLIAGIAVVFGGVAMAAARLAMLHVAMAAEPSAPVVVNKAFTDEPANGTSTLEEPLLPADDTSMAE